MASYRLAVRHDTAANWTSADPILATGEWGYESDTGEVKIGDGATAWTALSYLIQPPTSSIDDLVDVDTTTVAPVGGDVLKWNGTAWAPTVDDDTEYTDGDVDTHLNFSTATTGQFLSYDGADYDWADVPAGYADADVDTHLNFSTATTGQVLSYDGADYEWIDVATGGGGSSSVDPLDLTATLGVAPGRVNTFAFDGNITDSTSAETWTFTGTASYDTDRNSVASSALVLGAGELMSTTAPLVGPNDTSWFVGLWFKHDGSTFGNNGSLFCTLYVTDLVMIGTTTTNTSTPSLNLATAPVDWLRVVASTQPVWTDWNHYALQRDGDVLTLFLNGEKVAASSAFGQTYPDQWRLGAYTGGTMTGSYDDLQIHNQAIITNTDVAFDPENPGGGDVKVGEIDVTGNTTDSTMTFKQYESGALTSYTIADFTGGGGVEGITSAVTAGRKKVDLTNDRFVIHEDDVSQGESLHGTGDFTIAHNVVQYYDVKLNANSSTGMEFNFFQNGYPNADMSWKMTGGAGVGDFRFGTATKDAFKVGASTGVVTINEAYALPAADGTANQVLTTDGAGAVTWADAGGGGGSTLTGFQVPYENTNQVSQIFQSARATADASIWRGTPSATPGFQWLLNTVNQVFTMRDGGDSVIFEGVHKETGGDEGLTLNAQGYIGDTSILRLSTNNVEGVLVKKNKTKISNVLNLNPSATPASAVAGDIYYDSSTNKLRCYNGTIWNDLF